MKSAVTKLGNYNDIVIPETNKRIKVADKVIFKDLLNQHRLLADNNNGAKDNDYVLASVKIDGTDEFDIHIEMGKKCFPDYEKALFNSRPNDIIEGLIDNKKVIYTVKSVRSVVEWAITDDNIASLRMDGVCSVSDYRKWYINNKASAIAEKLFYSLRDKLSEQFTNSYTFFIDEEEQNRYCDKFEKMIDKMTGGNLERQLLEAYGKDNENDFNKCREAFRKDNIKAFKGFLTGKKIAEGIENFKISKDVEEQCLELYSFVYDTDKEAIIKDGHYDEAMDSAYSMVYFDSLKAFYLDSVEYVTE